MTHPAPRTRTIRRAATGKSLPRKHPERELQRAIVRLLRIGLPHGWLTVALNNNPRSKVAGYIGKSIGAVAGLPDLVVIAPEGRIFWIEVKPKSGRVSAGQSDMHDRLSDLGHPVAVARSLPDVEALARRWGWEWRFAA